MIIRPLLQIGSRITSDIDLKSIRIVLSSHLFHIFEPFYLMAVLFSQYIHRCRIKHHKLEKIIMTNYIFLNNCVRRRVKIIICFFLAFELYVKRDMFIRNLESTKSIITNIYASNIRYFRSTEQNVCKDGSFNPGRVFVDTNINVSNCVFYRNGVFSSDNGYGGIIYVNGGSYYMKIANSVFDSCSCSYNGGAIHFKSLDSEIKMICAHRCFSQFINNFASIEATQNNSVNYLSMSSCSITTSGLMVCQIIFGNQNVDNSNCSMNKADWASSLYFNEPSQFLSNYCTFSHNEASDSICIYFHNNNGIMRYASIVNNNSPSQGVLYVWSGAPTIQFCVFYMNRKELYAIASGSLNISNCYIFHEGIYTSNGNIITIAPTYQIQFFGTHLCNADNPLPLQSPYASIAQTPKNSHHPTPDQTYEPTYNVTIPRTYNEKCNLVKAISLSAKQRSLMFPVFISLLFIV